MKNVSRILTEKLLELSLFAMAQTVQTNMKIKINMLGDILSKAAIVQKIGLNKRTWMLAMAVVMILPMDALADEPPVIAILGSNPISVNFGSIYSAAIDAGATATDAQDGDLTSNITETNNVNTNILGTYYYNYSVTDSAEHTTLAARIVNVVNVPPPLSGNGTVIIAFDDGWSDTFDQAKSVLENNGQKGVVFVIPQVVIGKYSDYMNLENLTTMYGNGWDISSHSMTHGEGYPSLPSPATNGNWAEFYLTRANNSQEKYELGDSKDWLDSNGFTKSSMFFAYPFGTYDNAYCLSLRLSTTTCGTNDLTIDIKAAGYYVGARSIDAYSWRHNGKHPKYKNGDGDAEVLKMATMAIDNTANSYPAAVIDEINKTINENGLLVLTFHHIVTGTPASGEEYNKNNLTIISNYLAANSDKVKVQTFSQYFNVPNPIPTYNPGTPVAGESVIGSNWVKTQWTDGAGSKTDVFDVVVKKGSDTVGQTTYNVVNRYFNITGFTAGMPVTVEVTAINRSWGWTNKNATPLIINPGIPTYMPPTPTIFAIVGSDYVQTTWVDGVGNKTDKFNVLFNGVWNNGTTNHSVNQTGMTPGQSSDVTVYALNGTIMNPTPATLVSTITIPATYMPPTPTGISATMGTNWILTNWTAGVGNNTDYFNYSVNGVWTNGTTNLSINMTNLSAGNYTDVKVYAVNGSIVNPTPASLNTTLTVPTSTPAPVHSSSGGGSSSSSGSSSGSGGGGGSFYDPNAYKFERQDTRIQKDVLSTVQFKKNGLVDEVSFYGIKTYGDVTAVVSFFLNNPTTVPLDGVKTYFSVSLGTIKQTEEPLYINSGSITLTLDSSDIANKKVTFYRFVNGSWELLDSTELASSKDKHSVNFRLSMPGFSNFAVVIQDAVSENAVPGKVTEAVKLSGDSNVSTNPNVQKSPGFEVAGTVFVLSILFLRRKL